MTEYASVEHLAEAHNLDIKRIHEMGTSFQPGKIFFHADEETPACLYTDGDDGYILFTSFSEMFSVNGVKVEVYSGYCDIPFGLMEEIQDEFAEMIEMIA